MAEIGSTRPTAASASINRSSPAASSVSLQLTRPLPSPIAQGTAMTAEVLASRAQAQEHLLTLKMSLTDGQKSTVQALSPRAFSQGHTLVVQVQSADRLSASLSPHQAPASRLDLAQVPVGSTLQVSIAQSQALANGKGFTLTVTVLNGPLSGQQLTLESSLKLATGSLLNVQVLGAQQLALSPSALRLEQAALLTQLTSQLNQQGSLQGLLTSLSALTGSELSDPLKASLEKLLGSITDSRQLSGSGVANALSQSGAFLESRLLAGLNTEQDIKANLLRLIQQLQTALPASTSAQAPQLLAQVLPALLRDALERIQPKTNPPAFPLPNRLLARFEQAPDLQTLLKLAAAALSRVQSHQLMSLNHSHSESSTGLINTWQSELALRHEQQLHCVQIKIQSEQEKSSKKDSPAQALWRIDLAFNIEPLGALHVQAQLLKGTLSGMLWAERPSTAALINQELPHLQVRLNAQGLNVGDWHCQVGSAPQGLRTQLTQHWVNEKV